MLVDLPECRYRQRVSADSVICRSPRLTVFPPALREAPVAAAHCVGCGVADLPARDPGGPVPAAPRACEHFGEVLAAGAAAGLGLDPRLRWARCGAGRGEAGGHVCPCRHCRGCPDYRPGDEAWDDRGGGSAAAAG